MNAGESQQFRRDLFEHIKVVYDRAMVHSTLRCMSPTEFEEDN